MNGILVDAPPDAEPTALAALVREFRRELAELRQQVDQLRRENLELRQQAGYWKGMHAKAVRRIEELQAENDQLRGEVRELRDQIFGRKSEKASRDRSNVLEGEDETPPAAPRRGGAASAPTGPGRGGGTTIVCPSSRRSTNRPRTDASARVAARRWSSAAPRIPN